MSAAAKPVVVDSSEGSNAVSSIASESSNAASQNLSQVPDSGAQHASGASLPLAAPLAQTSASTVSAQDSAVVPVGSQTNSALQQFTFANPFQHHHPVSTGGVAQAVHIVSGVPINRPPLPVFDQSSAVK